MSTNQPTGIDWYWPTNTSTSNNFKLKYWDNKDYWWDPGPPHDYFPITPTQPIQTITISEAKPGWICPRCNRVFAPFVPECFNCNKYLCENELNEE